MNRRMVFVTVLYFIVIALHFLNIYIQNNLAVEGVSFNEYSEEAEEIRSENAALENQILEASSLRIIEAKAREAGMIDAEYIFL